MRARAGDPPRNMPQKILAARADDPTLMADIVQAKVDQVILANNPMGVLENLVPSEKPVRFAVEVAAAYDPFSINTQPLGADSLTPTPNGLPSPTVGTAPAPPARTGPRPVDRNLMRHGLVIGRAGVGFAAPVHLERFAAPARLALTDNPRLAGLGGSGMLTLLASQHQLQNALGNGRVAIRPPCSVQVLLSGKLRPFVSARDIAFELLLRDLEGLIKTAQETTGAPVVIEFAGPGARLLSIADRSLLCSVAPQVGACAGIFVSDEKTEDFLRDQRRSKAYRGLAPDAGAPCANVLTLDMSTVDPLVRDERGRIRTIRELEGQPVHQAILGGDWGASLRDALAVATLLKSKRVAAAMDFLLACGSRQTLEVLAQSASLLDLLATGARVVDPDPRMLSGGLYAPESGTCSLRTFESEGCETVDQQPIVGSPECLAFAVATGHLGDPRSFKRAARVSVLRTLPTEDVLMLRKPRGKDSTAQLAKFRDVQPPRHAWPPQLTLSLTTSLSVPTQWQESSECHSVAWIATSPSVLLRAVAAGAPIAPSLRAVIAANLPLAHVTLLATYGIIALEATAEQLDRLRASSTLRLSQDDLLGDSIPATVDNTTMNLRWPAKTPERKWVLETSPHGQ